MDGSALTPFAWVFMLLSMGAVIFLTVYCFYRILSGGGVSGGTADPLAGASPRADPETARGGASPPPDSGPASDPGAAGP